MDSLLEAMDHGVIGVDVLAPRLGRMRLRGSDRQQLGFYFWL